MQIFIKEEKYIMVITESLLQKVIKEELSKSDVNAMINAKLDNQLNSREFKKKVKELAADVVSEIYKILWQRNSMWKSASVGN